MAEVAERLRTVAAGFTERAQAVPAEGWDAPAPCEGWVARDVVRHLVAWMPGYVVAHGGGLAAAAVDLYCIGDVLIHTWDLARATGLDDALDADEAHRQRGARGRA